MSTSTKAQSAQLRDPSPTPRARRRTWTLESRTIFMLVLPSIILLLLIHLFPLIKAFIDSLHQGTLVDPGTYVGFQNYVDNLTSPTFWKAARFTMPNPALLSRVVDMIDDIPMADRDTIGDLYE